MKRAGVVLVMAALGTTALAAPARADGLVLGASELGPARASLLARVRVERGRSAELFRLVGSLVSPAGMATVARTSRALSPAAIGVRLRRLPRDARFALAEVAFLAAADRAAYPPAALRALQVALVDAMGVHADPALAPALEAAFEHAGEVAVRAAAAAGLGRLGEIGLPALLRHARPGDPAFVPAVRGLGDSHRPEAARALSALLDQAGDEPQVEAVAAALAEAGSSWAWATGRLGSQAEGDVVRRVAAEALVRNFARAGTAAGGELEAALRRVDHPEVAVMIRQAQAAVPPPAAVRLRDLAATLRAR